MQYFIWPMSVKALLKNSRVSAVDWLPNLWGKKNVALTREWTSKISAITAVQFDIYTYCYYCYAENIFADGKNNDYDNKW